MGVAEVEPSATGTIYQIISCSVSCILPISLPAFSVTSKGCSADVSWQSSAEINSSRYDVEYSTNGLAYDYIGSITSKNISYGAHYSFTHTSPAAGKGFYRLKMVDKDGSFKYSPVTSVINNCAGNVYIGPNPVRNSLRITGLIAGENITVHNAYGQLLTNIKSTDNTINIQTEIWAKGLYFVRILLDGNTIASQKIVK